MRIVVPACFEIMAFLVAPLKAVLALDSVTDCFLWDILRLVDDLFMEVEDFCYFLVVVVVFYP